MSLPMRIALQASFFATLGLGAYAIRKLTSTELHPLISSDFPDIGDERYANIAATLSQLGTVVEESSFRAILLLMRRIVAADLASGPRAQWEISRASAELMRLARAACAAAPASDEAYRSSMHAQEETLPQLQGQLDDLLHNHLLARNA